MPPGTEVSSDARLRLGLLLVILAGLALYAVTHWPWGGKDEGLATAAPSCPSEEAPEPRTVSLDRIAELGRQISAEALFGVNLHSYEEGFVGTGSAWSDGEPTMQPVGESEDGVPAGYEIRWWTPSRDDVVADVWLFADPQSARSFLTLASSPACRTAPTAAAASAPDGGRNLEWRNPYGFVQQDLFLAQGARVYRLSVVQAGEDGKPSAAERRRGFALVDALGCSVLGLDCALRQSDSGRLA